MFFGRFPIYSLRISHSGLLSWDSYFTNYNKKFRMAFRQKGALYDYLTSITKESSFPREQLEEYVSRNSPADRDCLSVLKQSIQLYDLDCVQYKMAAVAIWLCGTRNIKQSISDSLSFFETLMRSRLLMLIFDLNGTFSLPNVLTFLQEPLTITVRRCLEQGYSGQLLDIFRSCNKSGNSYNQVLFLLEFLLVRKVQNMLDEESANEFLSVLGDILPAIKMERILNKETMVKMKYTGYLRAEEESCDTYHFAVKDGKIIKMIDKSALPHWVLQAYIRRPKPIDMARFRSNHFLDVFLLMSEAQIYASSPLIDDLEVLISDEQFQMMFQSFLLGHPLAEGEYQFRCKSVKETVQIIKDKLSAQNQPYRRAIVTEVLGLTPRNQNKK